MTTINEIIELGHERNSWNEDCEPYRFFDARRRMEVIPAFQEWDKTGKLETGVSAITLFLGQDILTQAEIDALVGYICRTSGDIESTLLHVGPLSTENIRALEAQIPETDRTRCMELRTKIQEKLKENRK